MLPFIKDVIDGVRIDRISAYTFSKKHLTSVQIPNGVTYIESHVFYNNQLTDVRIPKTTLVYDYACAHDVRILHQ